MTDAINIIPKSELPDGWDYDESNINAHIYTSKISGWEYYVVVLKARNSTDVLLQKSPETPVEYKYKIPTNQANEKAIELMGDAKQIIESRNI